MEKSESNGYLHSQFLLHLSPLRMLKSFILENSAYLMENGYNGVRLKVQSFPVQKAENRCMFYALGVEVHL